jgi:hypothetical protein
MNELLNTVNTARMHYQKGCYTVGSGPVGVIILGSCRVLPYVNYLAYLNTDNRFTVHLINVVNFSYNEFGQSVDPTESTKRFEFNSGLLEAINGCKWFIHEHTANYGMFNTAKDGHKSIYDFGMKPEIDISLPNFNDIFILFQELVDLDSEVKEIAKKDHETIGGLSLTTQEFIKQKGVKRLEYFTDICTKTSLPEMVDIFKANWREVRYWWTGNHISNEFTVAVFRLMESKFLHLGLTEQFWSWCMSWDLYSTPASPITIYDVLNYGINWKQELKPLKA